MYSYGGSSARATGKRGHGGRNYKPPLSRRDPTCTPPPLKECSFLAQFEIPEYTSLAPEDRLHETFRGRDGRLQIEKYIRSFFMCHLVVPGKKQCGPVALVGQSENEAIPAAAWLLGQLLLGDIQQLNGRIQFNVKDIDDTGTVGHWYLLARSPTLREPFHVFGRQTCTIVGFPLSVGNDCESSGSETMTTVLQTVVDNVRFRLGTARVKDVTVVLGDDAVFCRGESEIISDLVEEVRKINPVVASTEALS